MRLRSSCSGRLMIVMTGTFNSDNSMSSLLLLTGVLTSWCEELGRLLLARHQNTRPATATSGDCGVSSQKQVGYARTMPLSVPL